MLENGFLETNHYMKLGGNKQEILIKNGDFKKEELFLYFLRYSNFTMIKKIYKLTVYLASIEGYKSLGLGFLV